MIFRVFWVIICGALLFFAPWWLTLAICALGAMVFSWYLEMIIIGMFYDALFGGVVGAWYVHLVHTAIFTGALLLIEGIKTRINV